MILKFIRYWKNKERLQYVIKRKERISRWSSWASWGKIGESLGYKTTFPDFFNITVSCERNGSLFSRKGQEHLLLSPGTFLARHRREWLRAWHTKHPTSYTPSQLQFPHRQTMEENAFFSELRVFSELKWA